jgi:hypothetical protein
MGKSKNRPKREQKSKSKSAQNQTVFRKRNRKLESSFRYYPNEHSISNAKKAINSAHFLSQPVKIVIDSEMSDLIGGSFGNRPWQ